MKFLFAGLLTMLSISSFADSGPTTLDGVLKIVVMVPADIDQGVTKEMPKYSWGEYYSGGSISNDKSKPGTHCMIESGDEHLNKRGAMAVENIQKFLPIDLAPKGLAKSDGSNRYAYKMTFKFNLNKNTINCMHYSKFTHHIWTTNDVVNALGADKVRFIKP